MFATASWPYPPYSLGKSIIFGGMSNAAAIWTHQNTNDLLQESADIMRSLTLNKDDGRAEH